MEWRHDAEMKRTQDETIVSSSSWILGRMRIQSGL
jgi:hypothetical protein